MNLKKTMAATACLLACATVFAADITISAGDTLDWSANAPAAGDVIKASGGTILFSSDAVVKNVFELSGSVAVEIANGAKVRFARKWLKKDPAGKVTCNAPIEFGSEDSNAYAYMPPGAIAFTPDAASVGAKVTFVEYASFSEMPAAWQSPPPHAWGDGLYASLYGAAMFEVVDGVATLPVAESGSVSWRMVNQANFAAGATIAVPQSVTLVIRRMDFNAETCAGSSANWGGGKTAEFNNNIICNGGEVLFNGGGNVKFRGFISGNGKIAVNEECQVRNIYGSLAGMSADSTLTLRAVQDSKGGGNYSTRLNSDFPGAVVFQKTHSGDIVSIGAAPPSGEYPTNTIYRFGALRGGTVYGNGSTGARLQYNKGQTFAIGTLRDDVAAFASGLEGKCGLDVGHMDDAKLYIKNGVELTIGATSGYPEIYYMSEQVRSNSVTIADGVVINKITIPSGKSVYLHGNGTVSTLSGSGTLVIAGGNVRIGSSDATAKVIARNGAVVTCGGGEDLDAIFAKAALWLDASDTTNMVGAWNAGWATSTALGGGANVLQHCPARTFNGAPTATWTNNFPLIEKWFDKRPTQRLNYGWQDRCVNYSGTLYTLVYPYLVPGGLNGRAYMSFGEHGMTDIDSDTYGLSDSTAYAKHKLERRRMPLMQDMKDSSTPEGHAVYTRTSIVVFGSQQGGGRAVFGGYMVVDVNEGDEASGSNQANGRNGWSDPPGNAACGSNFQRRGNNATYDYSVTNAFFASGITSGDKMWVDGAEVSSTATAPNGGWQVISFNTERKAARSFGMGRNYTSAGGQNYAEILLFEDELTTRERRTVEGYLAQKWNLPGVHAVRGKVTAEVGATVKGHVDGVEGSGDWLLDSPEASPTIGGSFAGRVGFRYAYADGVMSPTRTLNAAGGGAKGFVEVAFAQPPKTGDYPLVVGTAVEAISDWRLRTSGATTGRRLRLEIREGVLCLVVRSGGTCVLIR